MGALGAQNAQLMQGAGGLMANIGGQQGQLGNMMYQSSFTPMQQQLNAMQVGQGNAAMAQTGQLTGTGYGAQLGLGGIQLLCIGLMGEYIGRIFIETKRRPLFIVQSNIEKKAQASQQKDQTEEH